MTNIKNPTSILREFFMSNPSSMVQTSRKALSVNAISRVLGATLATLAIVLSIFVGNTVNAQIKTLSSNRDSPGDNFMMLPILPTQNGVWAEYWLLNRRSGCVEYCRKSYSSGRGPRLEDSICGGGIADFTCPANLFSSPLTEGSSVFNIMPLPTISGGVLNLYGYMRFDSSTGALKVCRATGWTRTMLGQIPKLDCRS